MKIKTASKLARYLRCSNAAITRWMDSGMPHSVNEKITYVYDLREVLVWLAGRSRRHRKWVEQLQTRLLEESKIMARKNERLGEDTSKNN